MRRHVECERGPVTQLKKCSFSCRSQYKGLARITVMLDKTRNEDESKEEHGEALSRGYNKVGAYQTLVTVRTWLEKH